MRIVDRKTFLALPAGTLFAKFPAQPKDGSYVNLGSDDVIEIKEETVGEDFVSQPLIPRFETDDSTEYADDSMRWCNIMTAMLKGEPSPPLDYDCAGRDGLFDQDQLFMVWNIDDTERLIARLQQALADQKGA